MKLVMVSISSRSEGTRSRSTWEKEAKDLRPHFHVCEPVTFAGFLAALDLPFSLGLLQASIGEFLVILRKQCR